MVPSGAITDIPNFSSSELWVKKLEVPQFPSQQAKSQERTSDFSHQIPGFIPLSFIFTLVYISSYWDHYVLGNGITELQSLRVEKNLKNYPRLFFSETVTQH